jgi:hypothetical protein
MGDSIETIMPKHVKMALEQQLEFQTIVSSLNFKDIIYARVMVAEDTTKAQKACAANTTDLLTRIKKAAKNVTLQEDLL